MPGLQIPGVRQLIKFLQKSVSSQAAPQFCNKLRTAWGRWDHCLCGKLMTLSSEIQGVGGGFRQETQRKLYKVFYQKYLNFFPLIQAPSIRERKYIYSDSC